MQCRYCLSDEKQEELVIPCKCKGSMRYVHQYCLMYWINNSQRSNSSQGEINVEELSSSRAILGYSQKTYNIRCEVCNHSMKYLLIYKTSLLVGLYNMLLTTVFDIRNLCYLLLHTLVIYYFFSEIIFILCQLVKLAQLPFPPQTKEIMKLCNEIAVFFTILWYAGEIMRYYGGVYMQNRNYCFHFLPYKEQMVKQSLNIDYSTQLSS